MKFYAVAKGRKPDIYPSWNECQQNVTGYSGAIFKSFKTKEDATQWMNMQKDGVLMSIPCQESQTFYSNTIDNSNTKLKRKAQPDVTLENREEKLRKVGKQDIPSNLKQSLQIYTDGACANNGRSNAVAGIGVYFECGKHKNISKRIDGKQTNNRAELIAIVEALKVVLLDDHDIVINTDSSYSINGIIGVNKIVKNPEIFREIQCLIKSRKAKTTFNKVKGHTGLKDGNYYADELATRSLEK
jgi:ribonuclease HI